MIRFGRSARRDELVVRLPDGRLLGYAEYGDPAGSPLVHFHGWRGSRFTPRWAFPELPEGLRLVAFERPGFGLSDYQEGRTIIGFSDDVRFALGELGIERFAAVALDEGAPYALACAAAMPGLVRKVALVAPICPLDTSRGREALPAARSAVWRFMRAHPGLLGIPLEFGAVAARRAQWLAIRQFSRDAAPADRVLLADSHFRDLLTLDMREAAGHGVRGMTTEAQLLLRPWGIEFGTVQCPVLAWHGDDDRMIPPSSGEYLCSLVPGCRLERVQGVGHLWPAARSRAVLDALMV